MNLYTIALPERDNSGRDYTPAHMCWQQIALELAGGYTQPPAAQGTWLDAGKVYVDRMVGYQVACTATTMRKLLAKAFELFPDQLAIFVAKIGTAQIHERKRA